ncbi:FadR/GntR family transcriptional regulator [Agromyces archimandritae]|uniref:FadR family transcriptional regulator n=1 Tax=Agromyces archimandritae TaxID=2781962 RepID=A0A975FKW5_9MICO|nr:FCD domain-containing protein [Agromyces archimandritae]QTX04398.1 FadR family transcriptional regulator [Agromyces archimandritae]
MSGEQTKAAGSPSWGAVRSRRLSSEVVTQVMQTVLDRMAPGDWLGSEATLAAEFGISRVTCREAIRELEAKGVVEVKVGADGGIRVAQPQPSRVAEVLAVQMHLIGISHDEIVAVQRALSPVAAEAAAADATEADIAAMVGLLAEQEQAFGDRERFTEVGMRLHARIGEASGNRILAIVLSALDPLEQPAFSTHADTQRSRRVLEAHRAIVDAIAAHDGAAARAAMTEHFEAFGAH